MNLENKPAQSNLGKLVLAGGGSGGHVLPALTIAEEWKKRGGEILYVGAYGGMEEKLVPKAGHPLVLLKTGSLKGASFGKRLKTMSQLPLSFLKSLGILLHDRPKAVLGVGGYASGPFVLMASFLSPFLGTRTAIIMPDAVAGFTNRILGRFVDLVFCTFRETAKFFNETKCRYPGNPIRNVMQRCPPSNAANPTLFIFGGSQGALGMNTLVLNALPEILKAVPGLKIIHQAGKIDFERVKKTHTEINSGARVEVFIDNMLECYQSARLVIGRAGIGTLAELAAVGRTAVLVPLPTAADNHQEVNARIYERAGAVQVAPQNTPPQDFAQMVIGLLKSPDAIQKMETTITQFHRPHAVKEIVDLLSHS